MSVHDSPEPSRSQDGPADLQAVYAYLALTEFKDAAVAALVEPVLASDQGKGSWAAAAIDRIGELNNELARRRRDMVRGMTLATLNRILKESGYNRSALRNAPGPDENSLADPTIVPVLLQIREITLSEERQAEAARKSHLDSVLAAASASTTLPRPALPCSLETALRFATHSSDKRISRVLLERAFFDYLSVRSKPSGRITEAGVQDLVDIHTEVLNGTRGVDPDDPCRLSTRQEQELALEDSLEWLTRLREERAYRDDFWPGRPVPAAIAAMATADESRWQQTDCVAKEEQLAWLCTKFSPFFHKHKVAYVRMFKAEHKPTKTRSNKTRKAGAKGLVARERERWVRHTAAFLGFLNAGGKPTLLEALIAAVETYSLHHSGEKSRQAQKNVREFLGSLCNGAMLHKSARIVHEPLAKTKGFLALTTDTVEECLRLMSSELLK